MIGTDGEKVSRRTPSCQCDSIMLMMMKRILEVQFLVVLGSFAAKFQPIGLLGRGFSNGPIDRGSISDRVIPKTWEILLDISLLNTHRYKVRIKCRMERSKVRSSALPNISAYLLMKREPFGRPRPRSPTFLFVVYFLPVRKKVFINHILSNARLSWEV